MACELRYWRLGESRGRKGFDNWFVNEKDGNAWLLIVKKSSACMPVDWQSSPQHHACLSMPVVAGEKRGDYPPVDCDCHCRACLRLQSQARNEAPARLSTATV
eukprot:scaffold84425_cov53-Cyclotella_meneghiniana.AAC.2